MNNNWSNNRFEKKYNFKNICSQYIKFGNDRKIINKITNVNNFNNINVKTNEHMKISIYENIKEKIKDPYNIIGNKLNSNIISSGYIININDNLDQIDIDKIIINDRSLKDDSNLFNGVSKNSEGKNI